MKLIKISDLFDVVYGTNLALNKCEEDENGVNFVSRTSKNNGVSAKIKKLPDKEPIPAGTISVAMGGSVLESFIQNKEYYTGRDMIYISPKEKMTDNEKLYYCECIKANKFRFNYGRQANKTFADLLVPDRSEIPDWVYEVEEPDLYKYKEPFTNDPTPELNTDNWQEFKLTDLFDIIKGNNATQSGPEKTYPYISSSSTNNGISDYRESDKYHPGGLLTVSANGACMDTFYQSEDFISCGDVNVLYPKSDNFNKYNAMFFIPILELEKFRFGYGRKSSLDRIKQLIIKLPTTSEGEPDYQFMENYIKTLPYSKYI